MWVTYQDIEDIWANGSIPTNQTVVETLITYAEELVLDEYPLIQSRIDAGTLRINKLKFVIVSAVVRALQNSENLRSTSYTTGPFNIAKTYISDGNLYIKEEEFALLSPFKSNQAYEIDLLAKDAPTRAEVGWVSYDPD